MEGRGGISRFLARQGGSAGGTGIGLVFVAEPPYNQASPTSPKGLSVAIRFVYFDLGNVLLFFDHQRMCRQLGELFGAGEGEMREFLFDSGLFERELETGEISTADALARTLERFPVDPAPTPEQVTRAAGDIFEVNYSMLSVIRSIHRLGIPISLLSNTNQWHWDWINRVGYAITSECISDAMLSYEVEMVKPEREIFELAIERAGVEPDEILYLDDTERHVEAAKRCGIDALVYRGTDEVMREMLSRGIGLFC